jgi:hypothetical protein
MISWGNYEKKLTCRQKCLPYGSAPTFWSVNWAAALLHLLNGVATFGLWVASEDRDNMYNLTETAAVWTNNMGTNDCSNGTLPDGATFSFQVSEEFCISRVNKGTSQLSLWWLVIAFHMLSFVFQALSMFQWDIPCCGDRRCVRGSYVEEVDKAGTNVLRMVEYSVSATLMQIAIALVMGIWHRLVIVGIAFLTVVTMLLGLIAEQLKNDRKEIAWIAHLTGWVSLAGVWSIIGRQFYYTLQESGDNKPPEFVYIVLGVITLLYCGFGLIQFVQIWYSTPKNTPSFNRKIELAYCLNSLTSKTFLGWILFANALTGMAQS